MTRQLYYVYDQNGGYICGVMAVSIGGAIQSAKNSGYANAYSAVAAKERNL